MDNTNSEPQRKLWTRGDDDMSVGRSIDRNKYTTLVGGIDSEGTVYLPLNFAVNLKPL